MKSIYIPKRTKANWDGKRVKATFVVNQICEKIDRFKGFVTISSNAVIVWFFTFFLFFIQFGVQAPKPNNFFMCATCDNCTNYTLICTQ